MIRCVMIDLDGTLLRKPGKKTAGISDENEQALQRWQAAGGLAGIATSRSAGYIQKYSLRTWAAVVGWNGAVIEQGGRRWLRPLPSRDERQLWRTLGGDQPENWVTMVTPDNDWLAYDLRFPLARGYCENPLGLIQDHRQVLEWDPRRPDLQLAVILAVYPDACFAQAVSARLLAQDRGLHAIETSSRTLMIVRAGVDKAQGILEAGRKLGLKREEIAVIGDDRNDLTCFKTFENSFCMASAEPEVRDEARWTVESVAEALAIVQRENKQRS